MADPLSIAASVAGLISLAGSASASCYGLYRDIKDAPKILKEIIAELRILRRVLIDLKNICEQALEPLLPVLNVLKDVNLCGERLKEFERDVAVKYRNPSNIFSRVRWSFEGSAIKAFLEQLQRYRGLFESAKTNATLELAVAIRNAVRHESLLQSAARKEERLKSILEWLSPLEFATSQHDFYHVRRERGTSEWIEKDESFISWRDHVVPYSNDYKRTLWCRGDPGSGKTIACSVLINNLLQLPGDVAVGYIYCLGQDQRVQTPEALVGSLVKQMVLRKISDGVAPSVVEDLYEKTGLDGKPSLAALTKLLESITHLFDRSFIVADGIDELERDCLGRLLNSAVKMIDGNKTKFLLSSRSSFKQITKYVGKCFKLPVTAKDADIREYLTRQVKRNQNLQTLLGNDSQYIEDMITEISLQSQGQLSEETNKAAITAQLKHPSESLKEEYEKGLARMKKLPSPQYQLALRTMNYITRSNSLLQPEELQEALSVELDNFTNNKNRWPPLAMILSVCLGFVLQNSTSGKIEFFHITLVEFFKNTDYWHDLTLEFGGCCVQYLMSDDFKHPCSNEQDAIERRSRFPFAAYASRFWGDHIREDLELRYKDVVMQLLTSGNRISCFQLMPPGTPYDIDLIGEANDWYQEPESSNSFAIYSCAYLRLKNILPLLLANGLEPTYVAPFGQRFSPLHIAARLQDPEMCQWLIEAGADVNIRDNRGRTPMHLCWSHPSYVALETSTVLFDAGARFNVADSNGQTILQHAIQRSNAIWIPPMVDKFYNCEDETPDSLGNTALHYAVMRRYDGVMRCLLEKNANPLLQNNKAQSSLMLAMEGYDSRSWHIVKQILSYLEKDVTAYELSKQDRETVERYLATCEEHKTVKRQEWARHRGIIPTAGLQSVTWAAEQEDPDQLSRLILDGQSINFIEDVSGMTPLHHAALAGHELPTWHLLAAGAKLDAKDQGHGLTPLEIAEREGHHDVAALFGRNNSDPSIEEYVWETKSYYVGRGTWSKYLSGRELQRAYREAADLRVRMRAGSGWSGPGMRVWYEYLGCELKPHEHRV